MLAKPGVLAGLLIGLVLSLGCGEPRPEGMPSLYPTTVTVTQAGAPLAEATVTFFPEDPSLARWPVGGVTDQNGVAKLNTFAQYAGVPAGRYKVTVNKVVTEGDALPQHPGPKASREQLNEYDRAMKTGKFEIFEVVAAEFRMPQSTTLSADVTSSGANDLTFDVGAAIKDKQRAAAASGTATEYQPMAQ